jgi:Tfp pilus assembly protein PilF
LTIAVDVYGLGAILYELLTGAPPFSELAPLQVLRHIATLRPQRPRRIDASIPPELESICLRCLEKRPADRYPSADALADALQTWLAGTRRSRFPARLRWLKLEVPSRRRRAAVEATLVLVAGFVAAAVWLASREPISIPDPASALRTVAVLPDLLKDTPSEREAARHLAARLQLPSSLRLLPFDAALATAASHNPLDSDADVDAALGAFIVVVVATQDDAQKFALVAVDDLREERLYETSFVAADEPRVARELAAALAEKRGRPTAEAHLSRSALALLLRAIRLLQSPGQGTNALAIAALKDMIGQAPDSAVAHAWLAYAYLGHGGEAFWTDSAIDEAARAQRMDPTLGLAAKQLGLAYQQKGWLARALPAYEQARALGSLYVENSLGFVYYTAGRFADAYQLSLERQRFGTTDPFPQVLAAHVLLDVGETDAGERALRVANGKEPKAALRALTEAEIAWYRDDYATCRERAGRIEPGIPELYDGFFTPTGLIRACAIEQGDFAAALATMEMSKRAYAGNNGAASAGVSPALREAILLTQLKRTDTVPALLGQARQSLQAAIDGSSDYPPVWLRMAAAQRLGGEVDAAYTTLEHAFALGLTVNNRNRSDVEFLPFQGDARFESLRARSEDYVAGQREKVAQQLDPAMRERVSSGPHDANRDAAGAAKASAPDGKANPS